MQRVTRVRDLGVRLTADLSFRDYIKYLQEGNASYVSPGLSCSELVQRCMWKNTVYRCDLLFQQVFAQIKLCCAFNYFAVDTTLFNKNPPPSRCSSIATLRTTIAAHPRPKVSWYVYIDDAYNIPDSDSPVRMVNPSTEVLIALSPERTYATPGIKAFWPKKRECYYNDENIIEAVILKIWSA
ncbi:hypothetical protein MSG28_001042 [Choristoneura fumiferana]|uniref:Uncharacterized protein n=1 Tax=Choristoneura fumiferana TaxID=7141 RepID=A0ACC0K3B7_CHOFU|nr:hypothetical protein MSG28_001042 [Choristoneura fumiferana]